MAEAIAVAVLIVLFYYHLLDPSRISSGGDFANLFWPMKEFRLLALSKGVLPLWNPYLFMGSISAASMQHAIFYPLDYLFFWSSPLFGELNLYVLFHSILAGVGTWWWCRRGWEIGATGSIAAGAAFPCTAWFWGAQEHINQIAAVAWMPWMLGVLLLFLRARIRPSAFVAAYSALAALQLLVGHPQAAFYTIFMSALLIAGDAIFRPRGTRKQAFLGSVPAWIAACALAGFLAGIQLLPTAELSALSYRQFDTADPAYSLSFSLPPDVLKTYLLPNAFGNYLTGLPDERAYNEYGVYVGWATLILAFAGFVFLARGRHHTRRLVLLSGLLVLTILMALGGNASIPRILGGEFTEHPAPAKSIVATSLHELFVYLVPPARGFRVPARILVVTALLWTTAAAIGIDGLMKLLRARMSSKPVVAFVGAALIAMVWLSLYFPSRGHKFRFQRDTAPLLLAIQNDREADGFAGEGRYFRLTTRDPALLKAERQLADVEFVEQRSGLPTLAMRWQRLQENMNMLVQLPGVEGYEEGLLPIVRTKDFLFSYNRHLRSYQPDEQFLALLGVERIFTDLPINEGVFPLIPEESFGLRRLYRVPAYRGIAFWKERTEGIELASLDSPYWLGGDPLGSGRGDLLEYGEAQNWNAQLPELSVSFPTPNSVELTAELVVGDALVAMGYAPGWKTNGRDLQWINAVHALVPQSAFDNNRALLRYEPASYRLGIYFTAMGLMIWCGLTMSLRRRTPFSR